MQTTAIEKLYVYDYWYELIYWFYYPAVNLDLCLCMELGEFNSSNRSWKYLFEFCGLEYMNISIDVTATVACTVMIQFFYTTAWNWLFTDCTILTNTTSG